MRIEADLHTHTLASDHAYSTVYENLQIASQKGLLGLGMTDHGREIPDAPHEWHFYNMKVLPRKTNGVFLFRAIECSVLDREGNIDDPERYFPIFDYIIASMHAGTTPGGTKEEITETWLAAAKNSKIDIIGHPGDGRFIYDYRSVILAFAENKKVVEMNESALSANRGNYENFREIALLCKKHGVPVVVNSDAHVCFLVGEVQNSLAMLEEISFPEELVLNANFERLLQFFESRGRDLT